MNYIAASLCKDVLNSFHSNSSGLKESSAVRAMEKRDSHIFYFKDLHRVMTARVRADARRYKTYIDSFGARTIAEEPAKGSLTRKRRKLR